MSAQMKLNPSVAFCEKKGVYVFYYDFNYFFFSGQAAELINRLLASLDRGQLIELPESFLTYLKKKQIIMEV